MIGKPEFPVFSTIFFNLYNLVSFFTIFAGLLGGMPAVFYYYYLTENGGGVFFVKWKIQLFGGGPEVET